MIFTIMTLIFSDIRSKIIGDEWRLNISESSYSGATLAMDSFLLHLSVLYMLQFYI